MHEDAPRYASLRDYVALIRRQRFVILLVTAVFGIAALGVSLFQSPTYTAQASIAFRDISQDLSLLNGNAGLQEIPSVQAAREAALLTGPEIAVKAQHILHTNLPSSALAGHVSGQVGVQTALLGVSASWGNSTFSARLANAFAQAAVEDITRRQRARLEAGVRALRTRNSGTKRGSLARQLNQGQIAQLEAVKEISQPARIVERALPPAVASSPRPLRNTILGLMVGLVLGLVAAFVRDSLDRKIRASRDAHDELGFPILGRVGNSALGSAGLASNGTRPMSPADLESFRLLRTNLAFFDSERPLKTVLVTSGIAGEGKSTVAASLAAAAVSAGQRTLLVDADLRRPMLDQRLGLTRSPGLAEYLAGRAEPKEILQLRSINVNGRAPSPGSLSDVATGGANGESMGGGYEAADAEQLVCIASGAPALRSTELLASSRCHTFLDKVAKVYDMVVIDTSPILASADPLELIPYVDVVLICVRASWATRDEARAVRGALARLPQRPTGLVVTGLKGEGSEYGYYSYDYAE